MSYGVYKDGKLKKKCRSESEAFSALHKLQPFSFSYARKYEGWDIKKIPIRKHKRRTPKGKVTIVRKHTRSIANKEIKGWKKEIDEIGRVAYGSKNSVVIIQRTLELSWLVYILRGSKGKVKERIAKYFKTKTQAIKFAKSWMKEHPNG